MKPLDHKLRDEMRRRPRFRIDTLVAPLLYLRIIHCIWTENTTFELAADLIIEGFGRYEGDFVT